MFTREGWLAVIFPNDFDIFFPQQSYYVPDWF
jgi:hypothetical protein